VRSAWSKAFSQMLREDRVACRALERGNPAQQLVEDDSERVEFDLSGGGLATMGYLTLGDRTDNRSLSILFVPEPRATVLFGLALLASLVTAVVRR
jgi:hypothetical protein